MMRRLPRLFVECERECAGQTEQEQRHDHQREIDDDAGCGCAFGHAVVEHEARADQVPADLRGRQQAVDRFADPAQIQQTREARRLIARQQCGPGQRVERHRH